MSRTGVAGTGYACPFDARHAFKPMHKVSAGLHQVKDLPEPDMGIARYDSAPGEGDRSLGKGRSLVSKIGRPASTLARHELPKGERANADLL